MLTFDEALARVLDGAVRLGAEQVPAFDAEGRVLAGDLTAAADAPAFDRSTMDGYAVRSEDLATAPVTLPVVGESAAGGRWPDALVPGTAMRIFTGAPIPDGADAVVMQENVVRDGASASFDAAVRAGTSVHRRGSDLAEGAVALAAGTRLTAFHAALLAGLERPFISVARRPVVAIVATGDELRDSCTAPTPGTVVNVNAPALAAVVRRCGGVPRVLPAVADDLAVARAALRDALAGADLVLTIGGVSVGDHDVVRDALAAEGVTLDFWRVAIKPGKPLCFGTAPSGARVLGLPGNPSSALLTFVLFGAPLLRALQGDARPVPARTHGVLAQELRRAPGRLEFLRVRTAAAEGPLPEVHPLGNQQSGAFTSFAWCDALAELPADVAHLPGGTVLRLIRLGDV